MHYFNTTPWAGFGLKVVGSVCLGLGLTMTNGNSVWAATPLSEIRVLSDVPAGLPFSGGSGAVAGDDETVYVIDVAAGNGDAFVAAPGSLFGDAYDLDAYHRGSFTGYSTDITTQVGGLTVQPGDVFTLNGGGSLIFDASAQGIPAHVNLDAISEDPDNGDLIVSFDTTVVLGGVVYYPADLIRFDGSFSLFFNGLQVARSLNLDGAHALDNGNLLMSFDHAGTADGVSFADEDIIEYDPQADLFEFAYATSQLDNRWVAADVNGLQATRRIQGGHAQFNIATLEVLENEGPATFQILRSGGSEGSTVVEFTTLPGTAGAADFVANSGVIAYSDGDNAIRVINIDITDDMLEEGVESFTIALSVTSGTATLGTPAVATVRILDDEVTVFKDGFE